MRGHGTIIVESRRSQCNETLIIGRTAVRPDKKFSLQSSAENW